MSTRNNLFGAKGAVGFTGIVGRQSKSKKGHQGQHHHPQKADLGQNLAKGLNPGTMKRKTGGKY